MSGIGSSEGFSAPPAAPAIAEDLLNGSRVLLRSFLQAPQHRFRGGAAFIEAGQREAGLFLIRNGFAFRSHTVASGRRSIVDILVPGDIAGLDHLLVARATGEFCAAGPLTCQMLGTPRIRQLMHDPGVSLRLLALIAETRWRTEQLATAVTCLDAQARIAAFILGLYQRLRRRGLINRMSFTLPLTQEQIGEHLGLTLVHVNRTLRRLREERLLIVDRQVAIIRDFEKLRELVQGLPEPAYMPGPMMPAAEI